MSESAAVIQKSEKLYFLINRRYIALIRESYRLNEAEFENSLDIVLVARPQAKDRSYQEIESALMHLAGRTKVLRRTETVVEEKQAEQIRED